MATTRPLALVTGGSSGIGFELARELAGRGHDVAISGSSDRVDDAARQLEQEHGVEGFWRFVAGLDRPVDVACLSVGSSRPSTTARHRSRRRRPDTPRGPARRVETVRAIIVR